MNAIFLKHRRVTEKLIGCIILIFRCIFQYIVLYIFIVCLLISHFIVHFCSFLSLCILCVVFCVLPFGVIIKDDDDNYLCTCRQIKAEQAYIVLNKLMSYKYKTTYTLYVAACVSRSRRAVLCSPVLHTATLDKLSTRLR